MVTVKAVTGAIFSTQTTGYVSRWDVSSAFERQIGLSPNDKEPNQWGNRSTTHWNFQGAVDVSTFDEYSTSIVVKPGDDYISQVDRSAYHRRINDGEFAGLVYDYTPSGKEYFVVYAQIRLFSDDLDEMYTQYPTRKYYRYNSGGHAYWNGVFHYKDWGGGSFRSCFNSWLSAQKEYIREFGSIAYGTIVSASEVTDYSGFRSVCNEIEASFYPNISRVCEEYDFHTTNAQLGDVCHAAIQNTIVLDTNVPMMIYELLNLKQGIKSLCGTLNNLKGTSADIKDLADLYLSLLYGIPLTLSDLADQATNLVNRGGYNSNPYSRTRALKTQIIPSKRGDLGDAISMIVYTVSYSIYDDSVLEAINWLFRYGVAPTLTIAWDLVPFSFVIDWFVDIGRALERFDADTYSCTLKVNERQWSEQIVFPEEALSLPDCATGSGIQLQRYRRDVGVTLHQLYPFSTECSAGDHIAELTAIIIQQVRK